MLSVSGLGSIPGWGTKTPQRMRAAKIIITSDFFSNHARGEHSKMSKVLKEKKSINLDFCIQQDYLSKVKE